MSSWLHSIIVVLAILAIIFAVAHFSSVKKVLIGRPMSNKELNSKHTRLFWGMALLVLASDLYSSVAYGPEAGITELAFLGPHAKWLIFPSIHSRTFRDSYYFLRYGCFCLS